MSRADPTESTKLLAEGPGLSAVDDLAGDQSVDVIDPGTQVKRKKVTINLGNMFICSHQGRMQYLMGRELVNKTNELIIFSDLKINLGKLESVKLYSREVGEGKNPHEKISPLFDILPDEIKRPAEKVLNKSLHDYFMCSSYIKFKNCAILRLKFEPINSETGTKLTIELIHEGSLEKDEEIVTNTGGEAIYWVKGAASQENDGLNANQRCEFPTLELTLGKSATFNIQGDIFVMRHGYGEHNRAKMDESKGMSSDLTDAALTPAGVKQCVEAAGAFESEKRRRAAEQERDQWQPLIPSDLKYCCSDLRRTWQSLSAFNLQREVSEDITMLPYMHEFEYKSILPYEVDDIFLTKGYLAAAGKFLGRLATGTETGSLAVAGASAGAAALGLTAAAPVVGPALMVAGAAALPTMVDQFSTRAEDQTHEEGWWRDVKGWGKRLKPSTFKNNSKVRRRRLLPVPRETMKYKRKDRQGGGMKKGMTRVALGEPGKGQFIRMLATENRSKFRDQGVFVGTEFTADIPRLDTVTINTDFYRTIKSDDPVLQEYRYTFFGILIECNNHIPRKELKKEDLKPRDPKFLASFRRSYNSKGSQQEKVRGVLTDWDSGCRIKLMQGNITTFGPGVISGTESEPTSKFAIVNPANVLGLDGGGLDGVINLEGGDKLKEGRKSMMETGNMEPGDARDTSDGPYGILNVGHIIHAVGADFNCVEDLRVQTPVYDNFGGCANSTTRDEAMDRLRDAYTNSIQLAIKSNVKYLAFPILSGSIFKGKLPFEEVVKVAIETINKTEKGGIKVIFIYGYSSEEYRTLQEVSAQLIVEGQGGGYRKTHRKKKRKSKKKTRRKKTSKKTSKKNRGTKMRKKKTHKRTKKNKKNKRNKKNP